MSSASIDFASQQCKELHLITSQLGMIGMLILQSGTELSSLDGAGLLAGHYYDPYPPRFVANLKEILARGIPMVMRIHPGVRYPMTDAELFDKVDLEGHVAAYAGYDDERGTVTIADPWPCDEFGGVYGGVHEESEEEGTGTIPVNGTLDYAATAVPFPVELSLRPVTETITEVDATISLQMPQAIRTSVSGIEDLYLSIKLPDGMALIGDRRQRIDFLPADGWHTVTWRVDTRDTVDGDIRVAAAGIVHGIEPYRFSDVIGCQAKLAVRTATRESVPAV